MISHQTLLTQLEVKISQLKVLALTTQTLPPPSETKHVRWQATVNTLSVAKSSLQAQCQSQILPTKVHKESEEICITIQTIPGSGTHTNTKIVWLMMTHSSHLPKNIKLTLRSLMARHQTWEVDTEVGSSHQPQPTIDSTWDVMTDAPSSLTMSQTLHQIL